MSKATDLIEESKLAAPSLWKGTFMAELEKAVRALEAENAALKADPGHVSQILQKASAVVRAEKAEEERNTLKREKETLLYLIEGWKLHTKEAESTVEDLMKFVARIAADNEEEQPLIDWAREAVKAHEAQKRKKT